MRTLALCAAFCAAALADDAVVRGNFRKCNWFFTRCQDLQLIEVPTRAIDQHMTVATRENTPAQMPETLLGLFYMESNPLADEVVSFAGCRWIPEQNACEATLWHPGIWSWSPNEAGIDLYDTARRVGMRYRVELNEAKDKAEIVPQFDLPLPDALLRFATRFSMEYQEDGKGGMWLRKSSYLGGAVPLPDYPFRRIVDGEGKRTGNWDAHYIPNIGVEGETLVETQLVARLTPDSA